MFFRRPPRAAVTFPTHGSLSSRNITAGDGKTDCGLFFCFVFKAHQLPLACLCRSKKPLTSHLSLCQQGVSRPDSSSEGRKGPGGFWRKKKKKEFSWDQTVRRKRKITTLLLCFPALPVASALLSRWTQTEVSQLARGFFRFPVFFFVYVNIPMSVNPSLSFKKRKTGCCNMNTPGY